MKRSSWNLPGIVAIGWVKASDLPKRIDLKSIVKQKVVLFTDVNWIDFYGQPECKCTKEKDNRTYTEEAELTFRRASEFPRLRNVAIIVKSAMDLKTKAGYIIGAYEEPNVVITSERNTGVPDGEPNAYSIKVSHKAIRTLVPCLI